eukprot:GHVU01223922.1.p3 GENE.GHVU01223922.1~~GHVU01223922.1.p3  ORF type:complete len:174 (+),score=26.25 GHVU01223922.1:1688-2209(+)
MMSAASGNSTFASRQRRAAVSATAKAASAAPNRQDAFVDVSNYLAKSESFLKDLKGNLEAIESKADRIGARSPVSPQTAKYIMAKRSGRSARVVTKKATEGQPKKDVQISSEEKHRFRLALEEAFKQLCGRFDELVTKLPADIKAQVIEAEGPDTKFATLVEYINNNAADHQQ